MSFLKSLFGKLKNQKQNAKIVLLGPSGAGKTTLVRFLETGEPVEQDPKSTLGIDIRKTPFQMGGWSFKAIDVGGQELYQKTFWALGVDQADSVIFVLDGTTKPSEENDKFENAVFQFEYMLSLVNEDIPILILVNKQDLKDLEPLSTEAAIRLYGIDKVGGRSFNVLPSSAKFGDGVEIAMEWMIEKMSE